MYLSNENKCTCTNLLNETELSYGNVQLFWYSKLFEPNENKKK